MQKYKRKSRRMFFSPSAVGCQLSAFSLNPKSQTLNPNFVILIDNVNIRRVYD
ncbi:hypothetical protein JW879_01780 [candidate division WOR-3 bacterium]|nr:hypothetical protein [candidate division WOR-3 bacterium]